MRALPASSPMAFPIGRDKPCSCGHFAAGVGKDYLTLAEAVAKGLRVEVSKSLKKL